LTVCLLPADALVAEEEPVDAALPAAAVVGDVAELLGLDDELQAASTSPRQTSTAYNLRDPKPPMTLNCSPLQRECRGAIGEPPDDTDSIYI
jgi:hypothetical protein